jgi:hypothetical protein
MIIEKVQGSTNFLKSGTVMHAILRNSQCWCVDGESRFVLRTGKFQYYRIELPTNNDDDRAKVEELKVLLQKILRFERTPCPFKRGFHVDLAESDITPRRKGTWKRRQSLQIPTPVGGTPSPLSRGKSSRTEAMQVGTPFCKDGQEDESPKNGSSTNSSEFDEDELHSESDDHEERATHLQITPSSEPLMDRLDKPDGDESESPHTGGGETASVGFISEQAIAKASVSSRDTPEMILEDPPSVQAHFTQEETKLIPEVAPAEPEVDATEVDSLTTGTSVKPDATEVNFLIAEVSLKQDAKVDATEIESLTAIASLKPDAEVDATDVDSFAAEASIKPDADVEAASQATVPLPESTPEEPSPSAAIAAEPTSTEIDDQNAQIQELGENEADDAVDDVEVESDSRPIDTMSITSSTNSFHSLDDLESPTLPISLSPPDSPPSPTPRAELLDPLDVHNHHAHKRELSELTIIPSSPHLELLSDRPSTSASDRPTTPPLARPSTSDGSWTEVETPSTPLPTSQIRHRLKSRRSLSPLPPSPILFTPPPPQDRSNHLTSVILQKACSLALGKPVEVVVMLIHILARIAAGATVNDLLNGDLFKKPGQEREHQHSRSPPDQIDGKGDDLDEDDFGVPLRGRSRSKEVVNADDDTDSLLELD